MPRITIDHHDSRQDAASVLAALRDVGMKPGDVGSLWLRYPPGNGADRPDELPGDLRQTTLADLGVVQMSGWIATVAHAAETKPPLLDLTDLLVDADLDAGEIDKVRETLLAGGGIIGVRA